MPKHNPDILQAVRQTARGLYKAGAMDRATLREIVRLCLPRVAPKSPEVDA